MSEIPAPRIEAGDCREVMARMVAEGAVFDSCVTDPPYHLVSIVRRFGAAGAAPARSSGPTGAYARASAGFMGQSWDGEGGEGDPAQAWGGVAFDPATWRLVFDLLRPGGHVVAFSGTRTYHRMASALELAGFEIRDMLAWIYGTGFPKNHDVSKQIDKRKDWAGLKVFQDKVKLARKARRLSQSAAARLCGFLKPGESLGGGGFMWFETGRRVPSAAEYTRLKAGLGLDDACDQAFEAAEREVVGVKSRSMKNWRAEGMEYGEKDITIPETAAAKAWEGWGTALKPALEPICLARKPIAAGSVAANVMEQGTAALNLGGCAIGLGGATRYPANLLHDGSREVVEAFQPFVGQGEASPTRFFYCGKADKADRCGSKHPTIKPLRLMRWLARLVTPPGGLLFDPFAGSGTTGEAALLEGLGAVLIEREADYRADIERRLARARETGPGLFGGL